jgi:(1->4)-alpha-D-glucan 1-alpha-D-glucosylmutase
MSGLYVPAATYRLQFSRRFQFNGAQMLVPYLHSLGISDLYASPIFKARQGSPHGYDITDPMCLNPELGTDADFEGLVGELKRHEMGLLLDIVPNHMAASTENHWWMDFLGNGRWSPYAAFFDIDWEPPESTLKNRVLLPILVKTYEEALKNREIILTLENGTLFIRYHDHKLPLEIRSCGLVLSHNLDALERRLGSHNPEFRRLAQLLDAVQQLLPINNADFIEAAQQYRERESVREVFRDILSTSQEIRDFVQRNIGQFNGRRGNRTSFELLDRLLGEQVYQLAFWKTSYAQLNYRRFFDINDLIGIRVEEPLVFEATHALVFRLVREGKVSGLRIDHIDGLRDPLQYLLRLQEHLVSGAGDGMTPGFYVIVEKILTNDETLPQEWPVCGTTGYEFAKLVNALFVNHEGLQELTRAYFHFRGSHAAFGDVVYQKKKMVIEELFSGEIQALGHHLASLVHQSSLYADLPVEELKKALIEVTACLPVYRTYMRALDVSLHDGRYIVYALQEARRRYPSTRTSALDFLKHVLLLDFPEALSHERKDAWLDFVLRWQQLTGAVMAKGFEDTALYTYNPLLSLNEVGGNPDSPGLSVAEFHKCNQSRLKDWPHTMNTTSTHDTKRSEDVRARINILSEIPEAWEQHLTQWGQCNQPKKRKVNGLPVPEPNMEVLLYQTLVGAWPLFEAEVPEFKQRLKDYLIKAAREAKAATNWLSPDADYEKALVHFLESILEDTRFLEDFLLFEKQVAYYGALNSLSQVLLKTTSPGVPDFYQGTELWDFSLVDPDNRRLPDFERRLNLLDDLIEKEKTRGQLRLGQELVESWEDGRVKLYTTCKALSARRAHKSLFSDGDYIPLQAVGRRQEHLCAFARCQEEAWVLVVIPRLLTRLIQPGGLPVGQAVWGEDRVLLPENAPLNWVNIFTAENIKVNKAENGLAVSVVLHVFPLALLFGR